MSDFNKHHAVSNRRIAKNTIFLYIRMFFALIVTLYTSRVVLKTLGVMDYGVYNTIAGFVTMFAFLNSTLSASIQRFYNFEGAQHGDDGYQKVYIVGILVHFVVMIVILVLLETVGLWYLNNVMVIPSDRLLSANIVFQTSVISLCFLVMSIPYSGAIMATERMDFYAMVSILDTILKLLCVIALPHLPYDKLSSYGVLLLLVSIVIFFIYSYYAKRRILRFSFNLQCDKSLMKKMLSFSSWNLVGTFAFMLKGEALNILLNFFFGPLINAARAIAFQIGNAISSFSANITIAFKPQMVTSYSQGNNDRVNFLFFIQSKVCFALIAILIVPVILNINYILRIWLGNDVPEHTSIFSVLVLIDSLVCSLNAPCTQVVFATGKIKGYQIASSCVNVLLLPFCWLFLYLGANAISTFIITIIISLLNQIFCVWQMSKVFDLNLYKYINNVIFPSLFFIVLCPIPGSLLYFIIESSIIRLFVITGISVITGLILTYFILFSKMERLQIKGILKRTV